jgi:class 3 adenylate cyclase
LVDRLVELRIISPNETDATFSAGDVRTARFVHGFVQGRVPLEAVGRAIQSGELSFAFFDWPYWERFGGLAAKTYREVSAETGLSSELLRSLRESGGFARPGLDDRMREDELEVVVPLMSALIAMGADPVAMERHVRIWGESVRRIAEADAMFYRTQIEAPLLQAGLSWPDMLRIESEGNEAIVPLLDPALLALYHAHSERTLMANVVEVVEAILERTGLPRSLADPPAMCFLDLSGFTSLIEEQGDEAAAEMSATLGKLVQTSSHDRGGRPVKWLGDGVMVFFPNPSAAVLFALEMLDSVPAAGLPPAHAGIDAGRVIFQDGDYFGRTVNLAARIAVHANGGQVLATDEVVDLTNDSGVEFVDIGSVELKGISRPVRLHEARRGRGVQTAPL